METMYQPCEKCRTEGNQWPGGLPLTLIGGYQTKLCNRHANEWHEMIRETILFQHYMAVKVLLRCVISKGDTDESVLQVREKLHAERRLYDQAKAWCQEPEAVPEQEADEQLAGLDSEDQEAWERAEEATDGPWNFEETEEEPKPSLTVLTYDEPEPVNEGEPELEAPSQTEQHQTIRDVLIDGYK